MGNGFSDIHRRKGKHINTKRLNRDLEWRKSVAEKRKIICEHFIDDLEIVDKCPICKSGKHHLFTNIFDYPYNECDCCGHIFLEKPLSDDAIKELYSGDGENKTIQGDIYIDEGIFLERIKQIAVPKVDFCLEFMNYPGLWVDIGCGTGEILQALENNNIPSLGIESDIEEVRFAIKHGANVIHSDVKDVDHSIFETAGVVSFVNILEHVKNPISVLGNISSFLQSGSYVVVEVPRHPSLSSYNSMAFSSIAYRHIYAPDHLHIFTEKSLKKLFKEVDVEAVAMWEYGQDFQDLICMSAIMADLKENTFVNSIMDLFNNIQQSIDDIGFSDTMFVIGRKI